MIQRQLQTALTTALTTAPAVFLQGARQVGKSTLAQQAVESGRLKSYVTLDDATPLAAAAADPDSFVLSLADGTVIDEVQRVPQLARAIKRRIDLARRPGQLLLTGSASVTVLPQLAHELVGRVTLLTLWPLSQGELEGSNETFVESVFHALPTGFHDDRCTYPSIAQRIFRGGFPATLPLTSDHDFAAYFDSYAGTLLFREVRDISQLRDLADLPRLLRLLAQRSSKIINYSDLSRMLGIPQTTLKRYMAILAATFMMIEVPAWFTNAEKRFAKASKLLLCDTGLACAMQGLNLQTIRGNVEAGAFLLENLVGMELIKQIAMRNLGGYRLLHFRLHASSEVDFVIENAAGQIVGVEVKAGAVVQPDSLAGLHALAGIAGDRFAGGLVLYCGSQAYAAGPKLCVAPVTSLWRWNPQPQTP